LVRGRVRRAVWAATVGAGWALAWLTSWSIGVDVDRAYHSFGASGALVATAVTGLVLRALLGAQAPSARSLAVQPSVAP
ncbi:hypothetical protein ACQUZK_10305, partial [Streptococcus pyogenes]|uniref:hypothetical protein n=1 Tax=Streptococcus pyogenes TaxID=1314 RepID=UPI003DA111E7